MAISVPEPVTSSPDLSQERANIQEHVQALGQKYMGVRKQQPNVEDLFRETSIHEDKGGHEVPIENFLNAQCTHSPPFSSDAHSLMIARFLGD